MVNEPPWWSTFESGQIIEKTEIKKLLPHRGDMFFLNRASIINEDTILGELTLKKSDFWTSGHFPVPAQNDGPFKIGPIFPGVLMVESSAQLGIVFWRHRLGIEATAKKTMLFKSIEKASFNREARPEDRLLIKCSLNKAGIRLMKCSFEGVVFKPGEEEPHLSFQCNIAGLSV